MIDTLDLGSSAARCEGSSPFRPTNITGVKSMNLKEVKSQKLYKEYSLEIPYENIEQEIKKKIESIIPTITIPGFRKGKAPVSIVRKKYEDSVLNDVIQKVVNLKTTDIIKEKKYELFRQPKVDLKNFEKNKPILVEIKLDLQPEIKLSSFKDIKINKYEIDLSKKDLDKQYQKFLDAQKSYKKISKNREIKKTDRVTLNFETENSEVPEYLKSQKNIPVETDIDQEILPGLNEILVSKKYKQGDKKSSLFDLSKVLKNDKFKDVEYNLEVVTIEEKTKFKISKEYLKSNGFKSEDEIKDFLKKNSIQQYNQGIKQIEKKELMDSLNKEYKFDLPEGVLKEDFQEIWHRIEHAKKDGNLDQDDKSLSSENLKKRYKKISERRVKLGVLLQFIAKEEKISISEEELSRGIMQYSRQYPGQEKQIMEYLKKNPSSIESIRGPILEQKIIDTISSKSTITNKKITEEQYKKLEHDTFDIKRDNL